MKDDIQFIIICRFSEWEQEGNKYPPFGVKYLIDVPLGILTEGTEPKKDNMTEEDWAKLKDPIENVKGYFRSLYEKKIDKLFEGDILFVEQIELVHLV